MLKINIKNTGVSNKLYHAWFISTMQVIISCHAVKMQRTILTAHCDKDALNILIIV